MGEDEDCQKLLTEKDARIRELEERVKELERKIMRYGLMSVYQGIIPDDVLEKILNLPSEQMVIKIGKYLKRRVSERGVEKLSEIKRGLEVATKELKQAESGLGEERVTAVVGTDLAFTQKCDFEGSDVMLLSKDLMERLGVGEGDYVTVRKDGSVNLRVLPYPKPRFVVLLPSWVRGKIGAKVKDRVGGG